MTQIRSDSKTSDFIKAVGCTSSANVWLRSANRGNANNAWNVNSSGNVNNNNAYNANRGCPDCFAWVKRSTHSADTPKEIMMQGAECLPKGEQYFRDAAILRDKSAITLRRIL